MKIIRKFINELSESEKNHIDGFIERNGGLIFHETKFNEIASKTFKSDLSYFLAYSDQNLIGICPVHSIKRGILKNSYSNNGGFEIPYGGWVFNEKITSIEILYENLPISLNESLIYWSFLNNIPEKLKKQSKQLQTGIVNLNISENELYEKVIHSKRRNMIRKAEKSGVSIEKHGKEGLPIYFNLMHDMHQKAGLKTKPLNYYEDVLNAYSKSGKVILMIAFYEERPLTGIILAGNKNVMHYWQGASANNVPNLGQGELLQWEAIKWAKNTGVKIYDLCVIETERLPHIAKFKMGFTKELILFNCISKKSLHFRVINKLQNVFSN
jgi:Acetyltransferase (GNAT) domain